MAQKSPEILVRPKCHDLSLIPLNILILDDQNEDLKSVIDQDKYTVHVGPLDEHYVSNCQKYQYVRFHILKLNFRVQVLKIHH